jgi:hypothetical protein
MPQEQVVAIAAKQPSLLSWNVQTIVSRIALVCQVCCVAARISQRC